MSFTPYKHQADNSEALATAIGCHGSALDASDLGTGKTFTGLLTAKRLGARPAILCPLAVVPSWEAACKTLDVKPLFIENYESARSKKFEWGGMRGSNFWWDRVPVDTLMLFDEVHRCRGKDTLSGKMLRSAAYRCRTLLMSATPFTNPLEARNIGLALRMFTDNGFTRWCFEHHCKSDRFTGGMVFKGGEEDMLKVRAQIFGNGKGVRTRVEDIPGFPETQILPHGVNAISPGDIAAAYIKELEEKLEKAHNMACSPMLSGIDPGVFVPLLRYRQIAEMQKCASMANMAQDLQAQGFSVALFVNFDASVEVLKSMLNTECTITGSDHNGLRQNRCIRFQWSKEPFIILNSQAGGTGISLHDLSGEKRPRASLISPGYNAFDFRQVFGRVRRAGGGRSVQYIVYLLDTVEEDVMRRVTGKLDNLDALIDGDLALPGELKQFPTNE